MDLTLCGQSAFNYYRFTGLYSLGHNPGREACLNRTS